MNDLSKIKFIIICLFLCSVTFAQRKSYTTENAHSHNDYLNQTPFYLAYKNGFGSIEADIFPVNGILYVAHHKPEIQSHYTLNSLYLNPLLQEFTSDRARKLSLLIDIKEDYAMALPLLIKELEPLKQYLSTTEKPNLLTIIISGTRPPPSDYKNYPDFIFFDDNLKFAHTGKEWGRIALVSLPFSKLTEWKGENRLNQKDKKAVKHIIDSVHAAGKPIRFWAAPDTKTSWKWQKKLRADLIGTDKIIELGNFLGKESNNWHLRTGKGLTYYSK
jgi:alkaline phosphatase